MKDEEYKFCREFDNKAKKFFTYKLLEKNLNSKQKQEYNDLNKYLYNNMDKYFTLTEKQ